MEDPDPADDSALGNYRDLAVTHAEMARGSGSVTIERTELREVPVGGSPIDSPPILAALLVLRDDAGPFSASFLAGGNEAALIVRGVVDNFADPPSTTRYAFSYEPVTGTFLFVDRPGAVQTGTGTAGRLVISERPS